MKKVLFVINTLGGAGAEKALLELLVSPTRVGQPMGNLLKPMLTRILRVTLLSSITASSKITKNYVNY